MNEEVLARGKRWRSKVFSFFCSLRGLLWGDDAGGEGKILSEWELRGTGVHDVNF